MATSITTSAAMIRTEPHRRLRPSTVYSLENDDNNDYSSEEEEQLLPPPQSWFASDDDDSIKDAPQSVTVVVSSSPLNQNDKSNNNTIPQYASMSAVVGAPSKAPSWKELSLQVLPAAARELLSSSMQRVYHYSLVSYAKGRWTRKYSDLTNNAGGYFRASAYNNDDDDIALPPFSSLPWVDRQLVSEWRTCDLTFESTNTKTNTSTTTTTEHTNDDDLDFDRARTLVPKPIAKPQWAKKEVCHECHKPFGPTLLRHHCRLCGKSYCRSHSTQTHRLPHLGYDPHVPERVCDGCKRLLLEQNLAERVAWRLARCRDYLEGDLTPYFETGVDTVQEVAARVTKAALAMARSIPLGAQAHVAVETVEVLRKHGLKGIYGLILRKEFMAAADLLCRALGINKTAWPLSVHELSAAIFYALAQHRAMRGMSPEREQLIHTYKSQEVTDNVVEKDESNEDEWGPFVSAWTGSPNNKEQVVNGSNHQDDQRAGGAKADDSTTHQNNASLVDETDTYDPLAESIVDLIAMADNAIQSQTNEGSNNKHTIEGTEVLDQQTTADDSSPDLPFHPVCEPVSDPVMSSLIFYAPIALNFVYALREVDMQLLAAQQGWRLLYAHLEQDTLDRPASALFVHSRQKIACFAVRGTATINDVVTDIRQMPISFPENTQDDHRRLDEEEDWTPVFRGQGLAVCGMARAAVNLYREHIDSLVTLAEHGYRIRITGHSLGGGVATLLGALVLRHFENAANLGDTLGQAVRSETPHHVPSNSVIVQRNDLLRVYGYGTPSCVDAKLSEYFKSFVTTVVLHDDVVPRLTPTSIRGLLKHLLHIRETWVKVHLTDDLMAITERARTVWAPKWRGSFTISKSSSSKFSHYCRKQMQIGKRKLLTVKGQLVGSIKEDGTRSDDEEEGDGEQHLQDDHSKSERVHAMIAESCPKEPLDESFGVLEDPPEKSDAEMEARMMQDLSFESEPQSRMDSAPAAHLMVDYMGGIDYRTQGVVIDGDEFFDADESLVEEDEEEFSLPVAERDDTERREDPLFPPEALPEPMTEYPEITQDLSKEVCDDEDNIDLHCAPASSSFNTEDGSWARFDNSSDVNAANAENKGCGQQTQVDAEAFGMESEGLEESDENVGVMLEETPLPRMFLPGKIVHLYTHRGGYKAAYVPRAFRELRRISLAGNMLSDHTSKSYYEALLEVQSVRRADEGLPRWTAFDEDDTCSCCASRFTWASTSDSEAQEARDKHNCRSCGTLVCNPCAANRIPLPSVGINVPVRVCDRCYNDIGGVLTGHSGYALTSSFMESNEGTFRETSAEEKNRLAEEPTFSAGDLRVTLPDMAATRERKEQPERQRERRSQVVDELASRINSSSVLNSSA